MKWTIARSHSTSQPAEYVVPEEPPSPIRATLILIHGWGSRLAHRQTVLHAGAGIYHSDGQEDDQNLFISYDVLRYTLSSVTSAGLSYPIDSFLANTNGIVTPRDLYRHRKDMYVAAWTASIRWWLSGRQSYLCNSQDLC
jgi:hypothetical protein